MKKQEFKEKGKDSDDLPGEIIRFNPSAETTIDDLFGRLISDTDSFSGFKFEKGPILQPSPRDMLFYLMSAIYVLCLPWKVSNPH